MSIIDKYIDDGSVVVIGMDYYYYNDGSVWPLDAHPEFKEEWYR